MAQLTTLSRTAIRRSLVTAFKIFVGILSGSAAVFSEGLHSFLDLVSAAVSFFTVREAGKPADDDHPFGHGKIETLSSLEPTGPVALPPPVLAGFELAAIVSSSWLARDGTM